MHMKYIDVIVVFRKKAETEIIFYLMGNENTRIGVR